MNNLYRNHYYRNNIPPPPPIPKPPLEKNICKPLPPPKPPTIIPKNKKSKKIDIQELKKNTCKSLNDVENFLCNFNSLIKYVKLYNLLKK